VALPKDDHLTVNVDVASAICGGLAPAERLLRWRSRILDESPRFDIRNLDLLLPLLLGNVALHHFGSAANFAVLNRLHLFAFSFPSMKPVDA
jgi:hypothetical protein